MIDLSICILTWNTKDLTVKCIESILKNTRRITYEIILVDNGSSDGVSEYIKTYFPVVRIIRNEQNIGFTRGNNQALKIASGRYSILLNNDTEVGKNCLDLMVEFMDRDRDVGIACCRMYYPDGTLYYNIHTSFPRWSNVLAERSIVSELFYNTKLHKYFYNKYYETEKEAFERDHYIHWGLGAFLVVRKEVIEQISILDERLFIYFEEIDWCKRAIDAGWKIKYYTEPVVIHHTAKSIVQEYPKMTQVWHHSRFYFFSKHYGWFSMLFLKVVTGTGILIRLYKYSRELKSNILEAEKQKIRDMYLTYKKILKMSIFYPYYKVNYE
ncbi:MAG: glycosyltransferase family 2 protein [Candidatus Hydrogenedentota bacterium]